MPPEQAIDPGVFAYSPGGAAPATQVGTPAQTSGQVVVPYSDQPNENREVPGLYEPSPGTLPPNSHTAMLGVPNAVPGAPDSLLLGLQHLLIIGNTDESTTLTIQQELAKAGFLDPNLSDFTPGAVTENDATYEAYAKLLNVAIQTHKDFNAILAARAGDAKNGQGKKFGQEFLEKTGQKPIEKTETTTSTDITDPLDAQATAQNEYQSLLGRNVSSGEASAYYAGLKAYEQAHPQVTTSDVSYDPTIDDQPEVKNTTTTGGINAAGEAQLADQDIIQNHGKEYAQAQGNQIYDLFASLIGGGQ